MLTAARELQQVNNEIQSLENQAPRVNQARNLASLPYSSLAALDQSDHPDRSSFSPRRSASPTTSPPSIRPSPRPIRSLSGSTSSQQLLADAQTRWQNALAGFQDAMHVQAGAVANLDNTRTQIDALVSSSQSATGALQAAAVRQPARRASDQQLADLTAVMAAIARAQSLEAARDVESQEQAQAQTTNFLNYGAGYQPGSAQMFH